MNISNSARLESLQALRGVAALLVMLLHCVQMTAAYGGYDDPTRDGLVSIGSFGIDIFFVLSGVVIALLFTRGDSQPQTPGGFMVRRAAKLLPTFWVTLLLMVLVPPSPKAETFGLLLAHPLSLVLLEGQDIHGPAWTLLFEMHFYLVAAVALCFRSHAVTVMLAWIPLQLAGIVLVTAGIVPPHPFVQPITLELGAGFVLGLTASRWRVPQPWLVVAGAIGMVVSLALLFPNAGHGASDAWRLPMFGVPAVLIVAALLSLDRAGWKPPAVLVTLGALSYSLYMWHLPVMIALALVMLGLKDWWPSVALYAVLSVGLSIWVASAAYRVIESPVSEWAARLTRRNGHQPVVAPTAVVATAQP